MTLLMSYPLSAHLVGPLVDAKTVHQQKQGQHLARSISTWIGKRREFERELHEPMFLPRESLFQARVVAAGVMFSFWLKTLSGS